MRRPRRMMLAKQPEVPDGSSLLPEARHLVLPKGIRTTRFPLGRSDDAVSSVWSLTRGSGL